MTKISYFIVYSFLLVAVIWFGRGAIKTTPTQTLPLQAEGGNNFLILSLFKGEELGGGAKKFEFEKLAAPQSDFSGGNLIEDRYVVSGDLDSAELKQGIDRIKNLSDGKVAANNFGASAGTSAGADTNIEGSGVFDKIKESVLGALGSLNLGKNQEGDNLSDSSDSLLLGVEDSLLSAQDPCGANETVGESCGGGTAPEGSVGECKAQTSLAFDYGCNYGNSPENYNVPESRANNSCGATVTCSGRCYCGASVSSVCGVTKRCISVRTGRPCQPVTCEQCCEGSAWLWDSVTGWCGCAR